MKTKVEIVNNWLPRYTGKSIDSFGKYFLLTNYLYYVELFSYQLMSKNYHLVLRPLIDGEMSRFMG